jgi:hypothetical protein
LHPDAPAIVRDVCASLHGAWGETAVGPTSDARRVH